MEQSLINAAITVIFGAIAGGVTNAVAIWMLFHPYESRGIGPFRIQGAIPKNKPRLAKTIGRTVGQRLITAEDLSKQLDSPGLREAFDEAISTFLRTILRDSHGSIRDKVPSALLAEIETVLATMAPRIADQLADFAKTDGFRDAVAGFQEKVRSEIGDRAISELLTDDRRIAIRERIECWVSDAVMSPDLGVAIGEWLDKQITIFEDDETPLLDRLPPALVSVVEKAVAGYLPMALDRIAGALTDPAARQNIQRSLHKLFDGFVKNLLLHERIVARLVVTEKTIARMLDNVERDGVETMANLLEEPAMRNQVARSVNDAVVKFLRQPLADHFKSLGSERVDGIRETVRDQLVSAIQDEATRRFAITKVDDAIREGAEGRTVADILRLIPTDEAVEWAAAAVATPRVKGWIEEGTRGALEGLLDQDVGTIAKHLPDGSLDRMSAALTPVVWTWIIDQIPNVVDKIDIQQMVEEKVLGFSLERIEEIVRNTTQKELNLIIKLGYVLGAGVGGLAYGVSVVLS